MNTTVIIENGQLGYIDIDDVFEFKGTENWLYDGVHYTHRCRLPRINCGSIVACHLRNVFHRVAR